MRKLAITPSSMFQKIEFNHTTNLMKVTFADGKAWSAVVDPSVASELETPGLSAGKTWHAKLKAPHYEWSES